MDENYKSEAKKTKKNILRALRYKLFNILIVPYDAKHRSSHWNISSLNFALLVLFLISSAITATYSATQLVFTNYKIAKLEIQNEAKKDYIDKYENKLRNYLVEYAPKKNYIESQTFFLPNSSVSKNLNIGGNEIKWDKDNNQLLEAHYEKTRNELNEKIINSKHLIQHLKEVEETLAKSENNAEKISKLFRENKKYISELPLSWPISDGLGEVQELASTENTLHLLTLPGSLVLPTGQGTVESVLYNKNNVATIKINHSFGITTKYQGVYNTQVKKDDKISIKDSLGKTGSVLKYSIAINDNLISAKDFSFLRY